MFSKNGAFSKDATFSKDAAFSKNVRKTVGNLPQWLRSENKRMYY